MQSWLPFPESASTLSGEVDALYFYLCGVTAFFTLLIYAVVIYFVIRYRRRNPYEIPRPSKDRPNSKRSGQSSPC
jgi:cytochrome c oxidase subunit 2